MTDKTRKFDIIKTDKLKDLLIYVRENNLQREDIINIVPYGKEFVMFFYQ
jgi:hypothetical protein